MPAGSDQPKDSIGFLKLGRTHQPDSQTHGILVRTAKGSPSEMVFSGMPHGQHAEPHVPGQP